MMIRLIATDMDGTLLNSAHEISEENIQAIKYAQSKGVTVAIATGRAFYEANTPVKPTGLKVPFICLNGAEVRDEAFNIIYTSKISDEQIKLITGVLKNIICTIKYIRVHVSILKIKRRIFKFI